MASIPYLSGGLSESHKVALASRAAALALAAILVAALGASKIETRGSGLAAPVVNVFIAAPAPRAPVEVRRPQVAAEAVVASAALSEGDFELPHLWTYDRQGRIVFRTDEQLMRCTRARRQGRAESDCPSSFEQTPMISREQARG